MYHCKSLTEDHSQAVHTSIELFNFHPFGEFVVEISDAELILVLSELYRTDSPLFWGQVASMLVV